MTLADFSISSINSLGKDKLSNILSQFVTKDTNVFKSALLLETHLTIVSPIKKPTCREGFFSMVGFNGNQKEGLSYSDFGLGKLDVS